LLTISVEFGLLAALLKPPLLAAPELLEELELELEPHAASTTAVTIAIVLAKIMRRIRAPGAAVDFICSPLLVRVMRPPSIVLTAGLLCLRGLADSRTYSTVRETIALFLGRRDACCRASNPRVRQPLTRRSHL
jgi:hypothetical protein